VQPATSRGVGGVDRSLNLFPEFVFRRRWQRVHVLTVVQNMKRAVKVSSLIGLLLVFGYLIARMIQTNEANDIADAFIVDLVTEESIGAFTNLRVINQKKSEYEPIIDRHEEALRNFSYEDSKPDLNFKLNCATVSVSWHLKVVLKRGDSGWIISHFEEHDPEEES
jgi:hypothetical protein